MVGSAALLCLATVIYYEARSEPVEGQYAVAEVVMNRVRDKGFPNTVCEVVAEDRGSRAYDCQFSFMCDGKPEDMQNTEAKALAESIAYIVATGEVDTVGDATYFHTTGTNPSWASQFTVQRVIGNHIFYSED